MHHIQGSDVNSCFSDALWRMKTSGVERDSRNGRVMRLKGPACITYENPNRRVLFNQKRDCNPFFHFMESLWMLYGSHDVAFLEKYSKNIGRYSDDGKVFHGAYGRRWKGWFGVDQLNAIADELRQDPSSRRCVLGMWDPSKDLMAKTKDKPCNTHAYFEIDEGKLNLTVSNRSNDLVWGALGANAVHFAFLLEWMAWRAGVQVGVYHQITNNLHIYQPHWWMLEDVEMLATEPYHAEPYPLVNKHIGHRLFDIELDRFMNREHHFQDDYYSVPFFQEIARPMALAYQYRREGTGDGMVTLEQMPHCDWKIACQQWIQRRAKT